MIDPENTDYENNLTSLVAEEGFEEIAGLPVVEEPTELINVEQPVDLEKLFWGLAHAYEDLKSDCQDIDDTIEFLQVKRDQIVRAYDPTIVSLEMDIRNEVMKQGKTFKCSHGSASFKHGPTSVKWDDKALLKYAESHEDFSKMVEYFRTVNVGKSSVSISVGEQS